MATLVTIQGLLETEEHLTIEELCRIVKVSRPTIYKMVRSQQMPPPIKLANRAIRWPTAEIREWLKKSAQSDRRPWVPWVNQH